MFKRLLPLSDRVLIRKAKPVEKIGGIILPERRFMQLFMVGCVCVMHVGVYLGES